MGANFTQVFSIQVPNSQPSPKIQTFIVTQQGEEGEEGDHRGDCEERARESACFTSEINVFSAIDHKLSFAN